MRRKFALVNTTCRRCGKPLVTGSRSLYGHDKAKSRLDRICYDCITDSEIAEIRNLRPMLIQKGV